MTLDSSRALVGTPLRCLLVLLLLGVGVATQSACAGAPIGSATGAAVPASAAAVDWSYAPRRSWQTRPR
jgi:hypothetical protein